MTDPEYAPDLWFFPFSTMPPIKKEIKRGPLSSHLKEDDSEVIVISSDEEDVCFVPSVLNIDSEVTIISDDEEDGDNIIISANPLLQRNKEESASDEGFDDDDLPSIDIGRWHSNSNHGKEDNTLIQNLIDQESEDNLIKLNEEFDVGCKPLRELHYDFPEEFAYGGGKEDTTPTQNVIDLEREDTLPTKKIKLNDEFDAGCERLWELHHEFPQEFANGGVMKKNIINNLLLGGLRGPTPCCCRGIDLCFETHSKREAACTGPQTKSMWETMFEDKTIIPFALRSMCLAVKDNQFLRRDVCHILLMYLCGSEHKKEAPEIENFHMGVSILQKQLLYHPPCRLNMRPYYNEVCKRWWPEIILVTNDLLQHSQTGDDPANLIEENPPEQNTSPAILEKIIRDFSDVTWRKRLEEDARFKKISTREKIQRMGLLLHYLTSVMKTNVFVWLFKYRHGGKHSKAFRSDVLPIVAEVMWDKGVLHIGDVNDNVKRLFQLYVRSVEHPNLHETFGTMISIMAAVLHRYERASYPHMGTTTRRFAFKLFEEIRDSSFKEENVCTLKPDWLQFHIGSLFLSVDEPPNFYKVKERINWVLQCSDSSYTYDVDKICFYTIRAMLGMTGLTPNNEDHLIGDEFQSYWFQDMLDEEAIQSQYRSLESLLSLPSVKFRKGFYFDGFEEDIWKTDA